MEESHKANITVQTHTNTVVALRQAVEAGVDLMQHCALTGEHPIPDSLIQLMLEKEYSLRRSAANLENGSKRRLITRISSSVHQKAR